MQFNGPRHRQKNPRTRFKWIALRFSPSHFVFYSPFLPFQFLNSHSIVMSNRWMSHPLFFFSVPSFSRRSLLSDSWIFFFPWLSSRFCLLFYLLSGSNNRKVRKKRKRVLLLVWRDNWYLALLFICSNAKWWIVWTMFLCLFLVSCFTDWKILVCLKYNILISFLLRWFGLLVCNILKVDFLTWKLCVRFDLYWCV